MELEPEPLLWKVEDVAHYLRVKPTTVATMTRDGRITAADGLRYVGRLVRFRPYIVARRIDAGLFGRGLGECGEPVASAAPLRAVRR